MAKATEIFSVLFHSTSIAYAVFSLSTMLDVINYLGILVLLLVLGYVTAMQLELRDMYVFQNFSQVDHFKSVAAAIILHFVEGTEGWTFYLPYHFLTKQSSPVNFCLLIWLDFVIRKYAAKYFSFIQDNEFYIRRIVFITIQSLMFCFLHHGNLLIPSYYLCLTLLVPSLCTVLFALPLQIAQDDDGKIIISRLEQEHTIDFDLVLHFCLQGLCLLFPIIGGESWLWSAVAIVLYIVYVSYKIVPNLRPERRTVSRLIGLYLLTLVDYCFGQGSQFTFYLLIMHSPQGYAITFMIDLAARVIFAKIGYQEHVQRYLNSGTWTSDAFLALVPLLEGLYTGDSGPIYAIVIFIITARTFRWLVVQGWFRALVIMIVAKLTVDYDEFDASMLEKRVVRWITRFDRIQHAMALLHLLYPQSVFQLTFDLISIVSFLLCIGDSVRNHFSSKAGLFRGEITHSLLRQNFAGVTLLHLYEKQDLLYYSCLLRSRADIVLLYYVCYVTFSFLVAQALKKMVQFDLYPLSVTSLLRQVELFLFQLCESLYFQEGFSMLLKFHIAMFLLFLLAIWLIQLNWLRWEVALQDAVVVQQSMNEATVVLQGGRQMPGAQPLEVRAVALLSNRGLADLDHLVMLRSPDSRFDMIWEAGKKLTMQMKRGKQIHLTWRNALYIPFVQYGVIGLTTLSHDEVHELCEEKVKQYNTDKKGFNLLLRSCQEFALEIGHAIVKRNLLASMKQEFFQPVHVIGETKTNLKILSLLFVLYLLPLAMLFYRNVEIRFEYLSRGDIS